MTRILSTPEDIFALEAIANSTDVRPWLQGSGRVELAAAMTGGALAFGGDHGGFVFTKHAPGLWSGHSMVAVEGRGRWARETARKALDYLFVTTDAVECIAQIPDGNAAVRGLAASVGFRAEYSSRGSTFMSMGWKEWAMRSLAARAEGELFHERLESSGLHDGHAEDAAHDSIVGACLLMARAGGDLLPRKAVTLYNRWAVCTGYAPVMLTRERPLEIRMGDVLARIVGDAPVQLERVACPSELSLQA